MAQLIRKITAKSGESAKTGQEGHGVGDCIKEPRGARIYRT
jgi:hypothetical protein